MSLTRMNSIMSSSPSISRANRLLPVALRSEEHTSELQSHVNLVCRLLLEKKNKLRTAKPRDLATQCDNAFSRRRVSLTLTSIALTADFGCVRCDSPGTGM